MELTNKKSKEWRNTWVWLGPPAASLAPHGGMLWDQQLGSEKPRPTGYYNIQSEERTKAILKGPISIKWNACCTPVISLLDLFLKYVNWPSWSVCIAAWVTTNGSTYRQHKGISRSLSYYSFSLERTMITSILYIPRTIVCTYTNTYTYL